MIVNKLKEINQLQNTVKSGQLYYKSKTEKNYIFIKYLLHIHEGNLTLKNAGGKQSNLVNILKSLNRLQRCKTN